MRRHMVPPAPRGVRRTGDTAGWPPTGRFGCAPRTPQIAGRREPVTTTTRTTNATVLVCDDDPSTRGLVRATLERPGVTVVEAQGVDDLVAPPRAANPDVLILDVRLGDDDGLETLEALRDEGVLDGVPDRGRLRLRRHGHPLARDGRRRARVRAEAVLARSAAGDRRGAPASPLTGAARAVPSGHMGQGRSSPQRTAGLTRRVAMLGVAVLAVVATTLVALLIALYRLDDAEQRRRARTSARSPPRCGSRGRCWRCRARRAASCSAATRPSSPPRTRPRAALDPAIAELRAGGAGHAAGGRGRGARDARPAVPRQQRRPHRAGARGRRAAERATVTEGGGQGVRDISAMVAALGSQLEADAERAARTTATTPRRSPSRSRSSARWRRRRWCCGASSRCAAASRGRWTASRTRAVRLGAGDLQRARRDRRPRRDRPAAARVQRHGGPRSRSARRRCGRRRRPSSRMPPCAPRSWPRRRTAWSSATARAC